MDDTATKEQNVREKNKNPTEEVETFSAADTRFVAQSAPRLIRLRRRPQWKDSFCFGFCSFSL